MANLKTKSLEDLPKFLVTAVTGGETLDDGYRSFEIEGTSDPALEGSFTEITKGTGVQWFWLLYGDRGYLTPILKTFDKLAGTAVFVCYEKEEPKVLGLEMAYLSAYWQAFNVWMVLDSGWGWERTQFLGTDAVAEDYEAQDLSIVEGREIRVWTKLEAAGAGRGQSRHYPATDQTLPVRSGTRSVPAAWGHEQCGLCNAHIDAGEFGYRDPEERWMCEKCYERYAIRHDLAFLDEL